MSVFEGKNTFNGKTVWVAEDIGWGEPSRWHLKFDDGTSLFVGLVAMTFKDQLDSLKYLLSRDAAGDSVGEKYIRELFDSNWKVSGQEDDAVKLVLEYVGYNEDNAKADAETIIRLQEDIAVNFGNSQRFAEKFKFETSATSDDIHQFSRSLGDDMKWFMDEFDGFESLADSLNQELYSAQKRIDIFRALQNGEVVGDGWSNDTFWRDFSGTDGAKQVAEILARTPTGSSV